MTRNKHIFKVPTVEKKIDDQNNNVCDDEIMRKL